MKKKRCSEEQIRYHPRMNRSRRASSLHRRILAYKAVTRLTRRSPKVPKRVRTGEASKNKFVLSVDFP